MSILTDKKLLPTIKRLFALRPFLDQNGIMRLVGRLNLARDLDIATKNPVVLDPKHPYTKLLIHHFHVKAGHHGREKVLNDLRQKYWILNGRQAVKNSWN